MNIEKKPTGAGQGPYERITKDCGKGEVDQYRRYTYVDILYRLAEFERLDLWPMEIKKRLKVLHEYVEAEMDGRLLKMPCPIGSKMYIIVTRKAKSTTRYSCTKQEYNSVRQVTLTENNAFKLTAAYGETAFCTRREAREMLKILEGNDA